MSNVIDFTQARAQRGLMTRAARRRLRELQGRPSIPRKAWLCPRCQVNHVSAKDVATRLAQYPATQIGTPAFAAMVLVCRGDCAVQAYLSVTRGERAQTQA